MEPAINPASNTLALGDPITFDQYRVPVGSLDAFRSEDVLGYRDEAAHIPRIRDNWWRDLGWVRIDGDPYRVAVRTNDEVVRLFPSTGTVGTTRDSDLDDDESWLARRIAAGDVARVGPIPPTSTYERRSYANLPPRRE